MQHFAISVTESPGLTCTAWLHIGCDSLMQGFQIGGTISASMQLLTTGWLGDVTTQLLHPLAVATSSNAK